MEERGNIAEIKKLRLQAVLGEYQALRTELLQKFHHHIVIFSILIPAIAVILSFVVKQKVFDLLLLLPIVSTSLGFRYIWEQSVIVTIGRYIRTLESDVFPVLLADKFIDETTQTSMLWVGWEHYFARNFTRWSYYRYTTQLLFVVIPFTPSLVFSLLVVISQRFGADYTLRTMLPSFVHAGTLIVYPIFAILLAKNLWKP